MLGRVRGSRYPGVFVTFGIKRDGSFPSVEAARKLVNATLSRNGAVVSLVASGASRKKFITATFASKTGVEAYTDGYSRPILRDTFGVGVVIVHDPNSARGFRVQSAYPRND